MLLLRTLNKRVPDVTICIEENVLRFQISMNNVQRMKMVECKNYLCSVEFCALFRKHCLFAHVIQQLASVHEIHREIDFAVALKGVVKRCDERVSHFAEYIFFRFGVFDVVGLKVKTVVLSNLNQEIFAKYFYRVNILRLSMASLVNLQTRLKWKRKRLPFHILLCQLLLRAPIVLMSFLSRAGLERLHPQFRWDSRFVFRLVHRCVSFRQNKGPPVVIRRNQDSALQES